MTLILSEVYTKQIEYRTKNAFIIFRDTIEYMRNSVDGEWCSTSSKTTLPKDVHLWLYWSKYGELQVSKTQNI